MINSVSIPDAPRIKAATYRTIETNAQTVADSYWFHTVEADSVTIARMDGTRRTLRVLDLGTFCDCDGFKYRGYCSHCSAFPAMLRDFSCRVNKEIEKGENRANQLIDLDIEGKANEWQLTELDALQGRLDSLNRLAIKTDTLNRTLRVQAMAGGAK